MHMLLRHRQAAFLPHHGPMDARWNGLSCSYHMQWEGTGSDRVPPSSASLPRYYLCCPCSVVYASHPLLNQARRLAERMLEPDPSVLHNTLCMAPVTAYIPPYVWRCSKVRAGPVFFSLLFRCLLFHVFFSFSPYPLPCNKTPLRIFLINATCHFAELSIESKQAMLRSTISHSACIPLPSKPSTVV